MASTQKPEHTYLASPKYNAQSLLANASEMLNNCAAMLDTSHRKTALGIAQFVMLGELAVNQALDHVELKE